MFENIFLAIEHFAFLALGYKGADASFGIETRDASATSAHPFSKRPLRAKFDLEFSGKILPLKLLVLADVG